MKRAAITATVVTSAAMRELAGGHLVDPVEQRPRFQAGQQEQPAFQQIDEEVPEEDALQPRVAGNEQRSVPAYVEAAHHGGEDAGAAERLRRPIGRKRREQGKDDLDPRVAGPLAQPQAGKSDREPECDLEGDDRDEDEDGGAERKRAECDGGDRETIKDQGRCVVGEALAFDDDHGPPRQAEPAGNRERGDLVGRRDDRAEHEPDRPVPVEQVMHDRGDRHRGERHAAEGEQADGTDVVAELAPAHGDAGGIDQRRNYQQEHELGRQLDPRQPRRHREDEPDQDQQNGRRNPGAVCRDRDCRHRHENENQDGIGLHGFTGTREVGGQSSKGRHSGPTDSGRDGEPPGRFMPPCWGSSCRSVGAADESVP